VATTPLRHAYVAAIAALTPRYGMPAAAAPAIRRAAKRWVIKNTPTQ
jgi:hypothetical protein